ncbi:indole-3-glycerol phosphate synthase TrpC [Fredinandcohnia quinoae]|uniref:Indole-3-glycerol phosphate synthase n=1 Tax=Fredinandcohnia quinoae TaxID=2918902 RepID=A0AAW5E7I1_9BACI|nr:indole-3-glycerol phosphate synthase TrpC [Fredinandcohnia sp. SECRCQ15]MCH1624744.1 indole-3-glycerol phosphate synthase TrpC [Fredinandcohnia sp. SECRCQ15]
MLNRIVEQKKLEIKNLTLTNTEQKVQKKSLYQALTNANRKIGLIAEIKKASPSKGVLREQFSPVVIASEYMNANVDAISVLTDEIFFQGSNDFLTIVKENVNLPVLRKDFIIDSKQIIQSVHIGADAILLIGEILEPTELQDFYLQAYELGLECLVEVHSSQTLDGICKLFQPEIIGINNRNLMTFETNIQHTKEIIKNVPTGSIVVSESGIQHYHDLESVLEFGADAVLIGEAFMREDKPGNGIKRLFGEIDYEASQK